MPSFIVVGDAALNLSRVNWVHMNAPGTWGIEVFFADDPEPIRFTGPEAEAVRCYLSGHGVPVLTEEEQLV